MDFKTNFSDISNWLANNTEILTIAGILAIISAVLCIVITKARKGLVEDVIFAGIFGLIFNVLGLIFVIFRKPVWNNLGWIPVIFAWFMIDANLLLAIFLCVYSAVWAFTQANLFDRIKVADD